MTPCEKLRWLEANCVNVDININVHRVYYQTAAERFVEADAKFKESGIEELPARSPEVQAACEAANSIVELTVYPHTPVSFYVIVRSTLWQAAADMFDIVHDSWPVDVFGPVPGLLQ